MAVAESPIIAARAAAWRGAANPERAEALSVAAQSTPSCSSQKRGRQAATAKAARARLRHRSHACVSSRPSCSGNQKYPGWSAQPPKTAADTQDAARVPAIWLGNHGAYAVLRAKNTNWRIDNNYTVCMRCANYALTVGAPQATCAHKAPIKRPLSAH